MSLFLLIVVAAALGALVLGLLLKVRLRDQEVWEELVDSNSSALPLETVSTRNSEEGEERNMTTDDLEPQNFDGEDMDMPPYSRVQRSAKDADLRRSSRVEHAVSLIVLGTNRRGEIFQERTSAVAVNLHGCRYSSRHEYAPDGWVTLQVTGTDGGNSRPVRARVRSVFTAQTPRELCQVGVELETPGNVWGISTPPEDWQRLLGATDPAFYPSAPSPSAEDAPTGSPVPDRQPVSASAERKAEVTMFPGPPAAAAANANDAPAKEAVPGKSERVVITAEQLLQVLQGKIQGAADRAVQASLSAQLDETVKSALGRIEEGWKANVKQTEEFSASRLQNAQTLWDKELHAYRDRAEDVARRIEALTALAQQALSDSQKFAERFAGETAPQLQAHINESLVRANSEFEARSAEVFSRQLTQFNEHAQRAGTEVRSSLEGSIAQAQSLLASTPPPSADTVSQDRLNSQLDTFNSDVNNRINTQLSAFRAEMNERFDARLGELYAGFEQQHDLARNQTNEVAHQLEGLALEARQARAQHEQNLADVRSLVSNISPGISQDQLASAMNSALNSAREHVFNHIEWRLGEVSAHYEQLLAQSRQRADELFQQLEKVTAETRGQLSETRAILERAPRDLRPQDLATIEQSVGHATKEFETVAARVSDRNLIRLMEQKQAVSREVSLELEARATETRAILQRSSNNTVEEFHRRVENQVDHIIADANERVSSSLASLEAESQAAVEARRRVLESDVARAAEQSALEFRSGIKAFLYSCLVAAVSAVDQHAQTTLAGLSSDPTSIQRSLESNTDPNAPANDSQFPPKAASNSQ
jgi:hypothetical protein